MATPAQATDALVAAARRAAGTAADPDALKSALMQVLDTLDVRPGDPAWADGRDVVGAAYERLVAGEHRRALGQFFTPLTLGRVMARWALADEPSLLLEPGCGSGSLLIAAAQERTRSTRLLGLDVDPIALSMAKANRDLRGISELELRELDFLVAAIDDRPGAILCNPPYTRHHAVSVSKKQGIHRRFTRRLGIRFSHLASLHVLFLVRALEISSESARLAFLAPAHWLDMSYAREVKKFLLGQAHVEAIVSFPTDQPVFEHAVTTASITLIKKGADPATPTRLIHAPSSDPAILADNLSDGEVGERVALSSTRKWSRAPKAAPKDASRLGDFARVRRGVATGCNAFFVISERARRDRSLGRSSVRPCLATPRHFSGEAIDQSTLDALPDTTPRWLVTPKRPRGVGPLAEYLAYGEKELAVRERHLVQQRERAGRRWFEVEAEFDAPILFTYFNRPASRFVRNTVGAVALNSWLVIEPNPDVDADELFELLTSAEVASHVQDDCRVYGNGLWKLEPSELKQLVLPRAPARVA